jgi:hypothetical protein
MQLQEIIEALPMDKASRMARAKALGFIIPAYHGTGTRFTAFDLEKGRARIYGFGFAPHFASRKAEASGYAGENGGHVLSVLLRVNRPFIVNYDGRKPEYRLTPERFQELTGEDWNDHKEQLATPRLSSPPTAYNALERLRNQLSHEWDEPRRMWTRIYHHLMQHGYDALVDPETPADHSAGYYAKYVVFEPKNIRLASARFDPAQTDSADLKA